MYSCTFCESTTPARTFAAREMMYGLRDTFDYVECGSCGSLQIAQIPADLARYYPSDYYSLSSTRESAIRRWLKLQRFRAARGERTMIGALLLRRLGVPPLTAWIRPTGIGLHDPVLDVGSGSGELLIQMHNVGFSNLTGVDPYIDQDRTLAPGLRLIRSRVEDLTERFSLVMFHHSLEHMADPASALRAVARLLDPGSYTIVRIPVAGGYVWREYGANWIQIDAPRHLSIPTRTGMTALALRTGFVIDRVEYDSGAFQFWGSEQYARDIPFRDERSYAVNPGRSIFTREQIERFEEKARQLNSEEDGDAACFYLRRV